MADATETIIVEETETTEEPTETPPEQDDAAKWKALSRKNEAEAKKAKAELEKVRISSMSEQERAVALARAEGRSEALKEANEKLLHAEVRAAAAGVLADPEDAVYLLDLDSFDVDNIDRRQIKSALADLVKSKPYLSSQPGNGSGEGGPRGSSVPLGSDPLLDTVKQALNIR